ncbi:hypothetical protein DC432_15930 [Microbacterium testaceum]|uniref:Uncharacterized protein n=1 Tax=Microbacterium testaceum TaxID=2033 RepID=A0A2T7VQW5_MICTE|nr:hypothetical protein DC432_15930 [Microbacterium testaceum]
MKRMVALVAMSLVLLTGCRSYTPEPDASKVHAAWTVCGWAIEDHHTALKEEVTPEELAAEILDVCGEEPPLP